MSLDALTVVAGFLLVVGGIPLYTLGIQSAPTEAQLAHHRKSTVMTALTVLVVVIALVISQKNEAYGLYTFAAWLALSTPIQLLRIRQAGVVGRPFHLMFAGQVLSTIGGVTLAVAVAKRAL